MEASKDLSDKEMSELLLEMLEGDTSVGWPGSDQDSDLESIFTSSQGPY